MRRVQSSSLKRLFFLLTLLMLLAGSAVPAQADLPTPRTPERPVAAPAHPVESTPAETQTVNLALPPLKAVLIVGPIDGSDGKWTNEEKANMDLAAQELAANGVTVHKFYAPNNDWEQIKTAANGAQFLMYRGHGVYWGAMPNPPVGGFALEEGIVSSDDIRNDLHLAPNAIVMLYGCFTAGSAGNDPTSISLEEAKRRVAMYSDPFFDIGAGGYYADWFGEAFQMYVRALFAGRTQRQAYESFFDYNANLMWRGQHPNHPQMAMWLGWDYWYDPLPQYNNAFAGKPDATLMDLFGTDMVITPKRITYLAEVDSAKRTYTIQVASTSSTSFNWTAVPASTPTWLAGPSVTSGVSGGSFTIELDPSKGSGSTTIRVTTTHSSVSTPVQDVSISLIVVPEVHERFLPVILR